MSDLQDAVTLAADLEPLKAFRIDCDDYDLLVFARTRNRARLVAVESGPSTDAPEYIDVRAYRHPSLDRFATREALMCCNDELPAGCPRFWSDCE
jgi:hypothetical protein